MAQPQFFDVVRLSDDPKFEQAAGKVGYILGVSEENGTIVGYGVFVYDLEEVWSVDQDEFELMGHQDEISKAEYARRPSIRVSPDGNIL